MDAHLKALADISLALTSAEEHLDEGANLNARADLDRADEGLAALREQWPQLSAAERQVIGSTAGPLRARLDAARARLPRLAAVTQVAPEPGEEDDDEPPEGGGAPGAPDPPPLAA